MQPKKNPKTESKLPNPEYLTAFPMPLLIIKMINITKINIATPSVTSRTYSLSIKSLK